MRITFSEGIEEEIHRLKEKRKQLYISYKKMEESDFNKVDQNILKELERLYMKRNLKTLM